VSVAIAHQTKLKLGIVSVAIARQTKLKLGIVSVAIARQTKLKLGHGRIPNTNLALVAEAEQPSPVFEPRDIGYTARVSLQLTACGLWPK
jgi:hypothetical protein